MTNHAMRPLTVKEATQIVYKTAEPSPLQLRAAERILEAGLLQGLRSQTGGNWMTTAPWVAEFLTQQSLRQARRHRINANVPGIDLRQFDHGPSRPNGWKDPEIGSIYSEILRDYFLAVVLRRRFLNRTQLFSQAVSVGQICFIAIVIGITGFGLHAAFAAQSPEQQVIQQWIAKHSKKYKILHWYAAKAAPDGEGALIRVQYRYYTQAGKPIETDRTFRIEANLITDVNASARPSALVGVAQ